MLKNKDLTSGMHCNNNTMRKNTEIRHRLTSEISKASSSLKGSMLFSRQDGTAQKVQVHIY